MATINFLSVTFSVLAIVCLIFQINPVVIRLFKIIIRLKSVNGAYIFAFLRNLYVICYLTVVALIFIFFGTIASVPQPITGNITATLSQSNNITGEITWAPSYSFNLTIISIIASSIVGAAVALFIQQLVGLDKTLYSHLRNNLLPRVNRLICANSVEIRNAIHNMPNEYDPLNVRATVDNILILMNKHLFPPKVRRTRTKRK